MPSRLPAGLSPQLESKIRSNVSLRVTSDSLPNIGNSHNAYSSCRRVNRPRKRRCHLIKTDEPQPPSCIPGHRYSLQHPVERQQRVGPPMAGTDNVPGPENCCVQLALPDCDLRLRTSGDISFHDWRRVRDAHVNKVRDLRSSCGPHRCEGRRQVDTAKLGCFRRRRVRNTDELHNGIAEPKVPGQGRFIERVPYDRPAARRDPGFRSFSNEGANAMAAFDQFRNEPATHVARSARHDDALLLHLQLPSNSACPIETIRTTTSLRIGPYVTRLYWPFRSDRQSAMLL